MWFLLLCCLWQSLMQELTRRFSRMDPTNYLNVSNLLVSACWVPPVHDELHVCEILSCSIMCIPLHFCTRLHVPQEKRRKNFTLLIFKFTEKQNIFAVSRRIRRPETLPLISQHSSRALLGWHNIRGYNLILLKEWAVHYLEVRWSRGCDGQSGWRDSSNCTW